jgi:phenolic acid decarboxylase
MDALIKKIIDKCNGEIEWAEENINEMNLPGNPHNYQEGDRVYFPAWIQAHAELLKLINQHQRMVLEVANAPV